MMSSATIPKPIAKASVWLIKFAERKSGTNTTVGVLTLACVVVAKKMLPLVWLNSHVIIMASAITKTKNSEKFVSKFIRLVPGPPP